MLSGTVSRRPRSGHPTAASAYSSWPTPYGFGHGNGPDGNEFSTAVRAWPTPAAADSYCGKETYLGGDLNLLGAARSWGGEELSATKTTRMFWPTPDAQTMNDGQSEEAWRIRHERERLKGYNGNGGGTPLAPFAQMWPTPRSAESEHSGRNVPAKEGQQTGLTEAANLWPTPRTVTGGGESGERKRELGRTASGGGDLQAAAAMWPTPTSEDGESTGHRPSTHTSGATTLTAASRSWATPRSSDVGPRGGTTGFGLRNEVAAWATPSAQMWRSENPDQSPDHAPPLSRQVLRITQPGPASSPSDPTSRRRLNPAFVEWLMGWPEAWSVPIALTACTSSVTASSRSVPPSLSERSSSGQLDLFPDPDK